MAHPKKTSLLLLAAVTFIVFQIGHPSISSARPIWKIPPPGHMLDIPYRLSIGSVPGTVTYGDVTLTNSGTDTVYLTHFKLQISKEWHVRDTASHMILPGASAVLSLRFLSDLPGSFTDTLLIYDRAAPSVARKVTLYGSAVKGQISVPKVITFTGIERDSTYSKLIDIGNSDAGPLLVTAISIRQGSPFTIDTATLPTLPQLIQSGSAGLQVGIRFLCQSQSEAIDSLHIQYSEYEGDLRDTNIVLIATSGMSGVQSESQNGDSAIVIGSTLHLSFGDNLPHSLRLRYYNSAGSKLFEERCEVLGNAAHPLPTSIHGFCYVQIEDSGTLRFIRFIGR